MSGRDPDTVREQGNALAREGSLYLRQHAHNPVDWMPWGDEAHRRAREEDKPIFLSIGYSSCHWCHVMEREAFADDGVARLLNDHFVPIKLDREERPDVDKVYMEAVQAMTGSGGWPLSVFLTPDLAPFFGATYVPKENFRRALEQLAQAWREQDAEIAEQALQIRQALAPNLGGITPAALNDEQIEAAGRRIVETADREQGGMAGRMKFPVPVRWHFLLHLFRRTGDLELAGLLRRTLDAMVRGGLMDQLGGGFHRYTVDPHWTVPHFEKMLYDNGQLAALYLEAAAVFGEEEYREAARRTLAFLEEEMMDRERGGFYASFDADSEGEEGRYYVWTPEEVRQALPEDPARAVLAAFGVEEGGNFEGRSVLTRRVPLREVAARLSLEEEEAERRIREGRRALLEARRRRTPPALDTKLVTAWNGYAVAAMARGARQLGEARFLEAACRSAERIWELHVDEGGERVARASNEGEVGADGILDDYAALGLACLELYQATGEARWLQRSVRLADWVDRHFRRAEGGFFQTRDDVPTPMERPVELMDSVEPSGLAQALALKQRLAALLADPGRAQEVRGELESFGSLMERAGGEMAHWFDVALLARGPLHEVVLLGREGELRSVVEELAAPWVLLHPVATEEQREEIARISEAVEGKEVPDAGQTAHVCRLGQCRQPTSEAALLREQLLEGWSR